MTICNFRLTLNFTSKVDHTEALLLLLENVQVQHNKWRLKLWLRCSQEIRERPLSRLPLCY